VTISPIPMSVVDEPVAGNVALEYVPELYDEASVPVGVDAGCGP